VLGGGAVSVVTGIDNAIEEGSKECPGLLVTSDNTACLDVRVTLVVNTGLNAVTEGDSKFGGLVLERLIEAGVSLQRVGHEIGVFGEIGALVGHGPTEEGSALLFGVVLFVSTSSLNPLRKFLDSSGKSIWWIARSRILTS